MSDETGARQAKDAISSALPKFESKNQIHDYLFDEFCRLDLERRERTLRDTYLPVVGAEFLDRARQDAALAECKAYQSALLTARQSHKAVVAGLRKILDAALGESYIKLDEGLQKLAAQQSDADEAKKKHNAEAARYNSELERVAAYEKGLVAREAEQKVLQSGLEQRSLKLTEREGRVTAREAAVAQYDEKLRQLKAREGAVDRLELESGERARELAEALSYAAAFRAYAETKGKQLYAVTDGIIKYFEGVLSRTPGAQPTGPVAPTKKAEDLVMPPGGRLDETALDLDIQVSPPPKPPKLPPSPPAKPK